MINDFIDGDKFESLADINLMRDNNTLLEASKPYIIYSDTDYYREALNFISSNANNRFILITHNSDCSVVKTDIPKNIIMWFAQNLDFVHPKIKPIPIGLERDRWHPEKKQTLLNSMQNKTRKIKALCQFNPNTYRPEREKLLRDVLDHKIYADPFYCLNGENFTSYVDNLSKYAFCLCPRGNGIDTHRMWEALYLGCIPITKWYQAHNFDIQLPILFIEEWQQITREFLEEKIQKINSDLFDSKILKMSYWKQIILNQKNEGEIE